MANLCCWQETLQWKQGRGRRSEKQLLPWSTLQSPSRNLLSVSISPHAWDQTVCTCTYGTARGQVGTQTIHSGLLWAHLYLGTMLFLIWINASYVEYCVYIKLYAKHCICEYYTRLLSTYVMYIQVKCPCQTDVLHLSWFQELPNFDY